MKLRKFQSNSPRFHKGKCSALTLVLVVLILTVTVGGTVAYLVDQTNAVTNTFTTAQVSCAVLNGGDTLSVKNTSNIPAYLRAIYTVNWMDISGNVSGIRPVYGTDYTVKIAGGWTESGGIWYYDGSVPVDGVKAFVTVTATGTARDGYTLTTEVVAEAIQAEGMGASGDMDAWTKAKEVR